MNPLLPFAAMFLVSVGVARLWRWPVLLSAIEAAAFAGGITLVFFGEELPLDYTPKAMLIVVAVLTSVWSLDRLLRQPQRGTT